MRETQDELRAGGAGAVLDQGRVDVEAFEETLLETGSTPFGVESQGGERSAGVPYAQQHRLGLRLPCRPQQPGPDRGAQPFEIPRRRSLQIRDHQPEARPEQQFGGPQRGSDPANLIFS